MKKIALFTKYLACIIILGMFTCSPNTEVLIVDDVNGVLGKTKAPVSIKITLNKSQLIALEEGRLGAMEAKNEKRNVKIIPLQVESIAEEKPTAKIVMLMPESEPGLRKFRITESKSPFKVLMDASLDSDKGQIIIAEGSNKVLQYNYQTVYEQDVIHLGDEKLEQHIRTEKDTFVSTSIYAVPRSDYIHPLYGLVGEMLTRDWPEGGHPHHRAIFWAWPEVEYGSKRGDIYALQTVFARPTGNIEYTSGPVYAQIVAENLWMWEDTDPIVREDAVIRVSCSTGNNRILDLTIKLLALKDSITIATRGTNSYGGLNLRMQTPEFQEISYFTDEAESEPIRAWSDFNGIFAGNKSTSGLMVLQHQENPEYPGKWVEYPDLAWVQPTFPTPETRYPLSKEKSLVLRYRLIIHAGGKPDVNISEKYWDAFHNSIAPPPIK